jgi:hypothetical protein
LLFGDYGDDSLPQPKVLANSPQSMLLEVWAEPGSAERENLAQRLGKALAHYNLGLQAYVRKQTDAGRTLGVHWTFFELPCALSNLNCSGCLKS